MTSVRLDTTASVLAPESATRPPESHRPDQRRVRARWLALLLAVVVAGIVLRFIAAGPLWEDEAQSVAIARLPLPQLFGALRGDGSPPLYYVLLHVWMQVLGTGTVAVRTLSGVFAVAALPLIYRLAGRSAGPVALGLAAVNPWLVRYATETRMYALEVLLVLLGMLALRAVRRDPAPLRMVTLAIVAGLLLLTHYWALYLYAATGAVLLTAWLRTRAAWLAWSLAGLAGGALLFAPWLPSFLFQLRHTGTPWAGEASLSVLPDLAESWFAPLGGPGAALLLVVWPLIVWGAVRGDRAHATRALGLVGALTLLLAIGASQLTDSAVVTRYTAVAVPAVLLLLTYGVTALPGRWKPATALLLTIACAPIALDVTRAQRTQADMAAAAVNARATPQDTVIFCPDQLGPAVVRLLTVRPALRSFPAQPWPGLLNWTDYDRRVTGQSPATTADVVDAQPGSYVWLVTAPGYAPFGNRCQRLQTALNDAFGPDQRLVAPWPGPEAEAVWRWRVP